MRREAILDFIAKFPGRDDDEISNALKIKPRQSVNQVCRALENAGAITRRLGPTGKLANYPKAVSGRFNGRERAAAVERPVAHVTSKPELPVDILLQSGFLKAAEWELSPVGQLTPTTPLPKEVGVYAFAINGVVKYVGVATMGISKRLYFYAKPAISQRTSLRLNDVIKAELAAASAVEILVARPADMEWNGLPVHGAAGLELGLIKKYALPWNMRSAR